jgi:alpha-L-fucosidase 2
MTSNTFSTSSHQLVYRNASLKWHQGFPLGNGVIGVMVWGDGNPLAFTLDHAELWDLRSHDSYQDDSRFNYVNLRRLVDEKRFEEIDEVFERRQLRDNPVGPTKVSIGRLEIELGTAQNYEMTLDIDKGVLKGSIYADGCEYAISGFVHKRRNVLCLRISSVRPDQITIRFLPLTKITESLSPLNHPAPAQVVQDDITILTQEIPDQFFYSIAWTFTGQDIFLSIEIAKTSEDAIEKTKNACQSARSQGFESLRLEHEAAWQEFWNTSAVFLPEADKEFLWYYGLYLLASSAQRGSTPPGLQGLWAMDGVIPPWRGDYHADANVQETFWPGAATGHLDLLDCWCDHMKACIEPAETFTRKFFGTVGTFWPACTLPRFTIVPCWHTVQYGWSHTGWLGWLVWLRWRYSFDLAWLKETGYPILSEIFKFYRANLVQGNDGYLHVPLSASPEYHENKADAWCKDPTIDLALIRRCCDWIVEMEKNLQIDDLTTAANEVRRKILPYALTDNKELCLWPGKPLDESHRHPSHLMAIHPTMDLTIDGNEEVRKIIEASVWQYLSLGQWQWAGHTYAQMISFAAVLGRRGWASECLDQFYKHWIGLNGLHFNADLDHSGMSRFIYEPGGVPPFTMEANCAVSAGICDMLVQGWNDTIRIFPAVPDHWQNVAFRDLRTEGAFCVSAVRLDGRTRWVKIKATVDRPVKLKDPFDDQDIVITGIELKRQDGFFTGQLNADQEVILAVKSYHVDWDDVAKHIRQSTSSRLNHR